MTFGNGTKHAFLNFVRAKQSKLQLIKSDFAIRQITPEESISIEEVMSQRSHDHVGGERRGRREGDALVRLRKESELTPPVLVRDTFLLNTYMYIDAVTTDL